MTTCIDTSTFTDATDPKASLRAGVQESFEARQHPVAGVLSPEELDTERETFVFSRPETD